MNGGAPTSRALDGRPVRIGVAGMGSAGQAFLPALAAHRGFVLAAFAEVEGDVRERMSAKLGIPSHATVDALVRHPGLDAIYVATPTALHADHVVRAAAAGLHVLVEKPMASNLDDASTMVEAAERAGIVLLVGHSHSYDLPIRRMRERIASGEFGAVRMAHTWCYTDWVRRPRRADELLDAEGGGVTFRQGAHQFDILRLLCGGRAASVRAKAFDWDPQRKVTGAHTVFIDFDDGPVATAVYNGYGGLDSRELGGGVSEWGFPLPLQGAAPPAPPRSPADELHAKQARAGHAILSGAPFQPFFGLTVASCERGDLRQSPDGLIAYSSQGRSEEPLRLDAPPRALVLAEFHDAISGRAAALHDGRWGMATLEVCVAALESSHTGREVRLRRQVALPPGL